MSIISIITIWLIGWLIYRIFQAQNLELSPASVPLMWILGTGGVYLVYYIFVGFLQQNPPPLLLLVIAGCGVIEAVRMRHQVIVSGWDVFRSARLSTSILIVIILMMTISILMSGFYADTTRMWLAKGDMLNQLPDYIHLMEHLKDIRHPDYPMVISHQYQWQLVWADDWISLKLSTWVWYVVLILSAIALFKRYTKYPVRWGILLAGYPAYWFVIPLATVDIPISIMLVVVISWILNYLDSNAVSKWMIASVCALLVLTKNEGFLIVGSIVCGVIATFIIQSSQRQQLLRLLSAIIVVSALSFISWYVMIVPQADIAVASDFGLSGFQAEKIPQVLELILPILFNPIQTAGLWVIFFVCLLMGYWRTPLLWMPALLYLLAISASYMFSVRETSLLEHIIQSYFRLILQITPLAMIYIAQCLSPTSSSLFLQSDLISD